MKICVGYVSYVCKFLVVFFFWKLSVKLQCRLFWDFPPLVPVSEVHLCRARVSFHFLTCYLCNVDTVRHSVYLFLYLEEV